MLFMIVAMFPGQGAQYLKMGEGIFDNFSDLVDRASNILGYSIVDLCNGIYPFNETDINRTLYSQPAIFLVSCLQYLQDKTTIDLCIGHSLGFISALFAAGVIDLDQGIAIVKKRAELMDRTAKGAMAAVIGNDLNPKLQSILIDNDFFDIDIANYNSTTQFVISGSESSILAVQSIIERNNWKFIKLPVSGAFHSRLMLEARISFSKYLTNFDFKKPKIDIISTMNGEKVLTDFVLEELSFQLERPVRWYETISLILKENPKAKFKEFGPGEVLTRLNKGILLNNK